MALQKLKKQTFETISRVIKISLLFLPYILCSSTYKHSSKKKPLIEGYNKSICGVKQRHINIWCSYCSCHIKHAPVCTGDFVIRWPILPASWVTEKQYKSCAIKSQKSILAPKSDGSASRHIQSTKSYKRPPKSFMINKRRHLTAL